MPDAAVRSELDLRVPHANPRKPIGLIAGLGVAVTRHALDRDRVVAEARNEPVMFNGSAGPAADEQQRRYEPAGDPRRAMCSIRLGMSVTAAMVEGVTVAWRQTPPYAIMSSTARTACIGETGPANGCRTGPGDIASRCSVYLRGYAAASRSASTSSSYSSVCSTSSPIAPLSPSAITAWRSAPSTAGEASRTTVLRRVCIPRSYFPRTDGSTSTDMTP